MENIVQKIKLLNYSEKEKMSLNKFMTSLFDTIVSYEDLEKIVSYLKENGIEITKPSQNKIFANSLEDIIKIVEEYKSMGLISALIEDPTRINAKNSIARIKYMMAKGEKLTKPNGKYLKRLFSKRLFEKEYGNIDDFVEEKLEEEQVSEFDPLEANMYHGEDKSNISSLFNSEDNIDEYEAILIAPQVPADDEAINNFDRLYQYVGKILQKLYNAEDKEISVPDNVCNYLMKLVAEHVNDDAKILYYALTYGKSLSDLEHKFIKSKIAEVLENSSLNDYEQIELGSVE